MTPQSLLCCYHLLSPIKYLICMCAIIEPHLLLQKILFCNLNFCDLNVCSSLESYSTCGKFRAVLMKGKSAKMEANAEPQQFIEVSNLNYCTCFRKCKVFSYCCHYCCCCYFRSGTQII